MSPCLRWVFLFILFAVVYIFNIPQERYTSTGSKTRENCVVSWFTLGGNIKMSGGKVNVKQLIAKLQTFPQDAKVYIDANGEGREVKKGNVSLRPGIFDTDTDEDAEEDVVCISSWS